MKGRKGKTGRKWSQNCIGICVRMNKPRWRGEYNGGVQRGVKRPLKERDEEEVEGGGGLPGSGSWFCGGVVAKGVGDEEGEVE